MAIICISRELAAGGEETARELAAAGKYRFIERSDIVAELEKNNITREALLRYDEKKPGFWAALSENRDMYIHYLTQAIYAEAARGDCVILGRGAGAILSGVPGVLCVLIVAPQAARCAYLQKIQSCDIRSAEHQLRQSDHDRQGFHNYFFDTDWQHPASYDITVNTGRMGIPDAVELIQKTRQLRISPEKEAEGKTLLEKMLLQVLIAGEILYARRIQIQNLDVSVTGGGDVNLLGSAVSQTAVANALEAARTIPGVKSASSAIAVVPPVPYN
ncbi:MAG: cytidylate kinase family protein [Spirochaetaceae bacterium]|nr:cytidylate kinase family protein [Spirochaetaceae bacterium]